MVDRMTKGILAGMAGAVVQNIYALIGQSLGLTNVNYLDVAKAVIFNQNFQGILALFVGFLAQLVMDGFWGMVFAFLIQYTSSKNYLAKGTFWGCGIWLLVSVIINKAFDLPVGENTPPVALFFFTGAVLFGLTIAIVLKRLDGPPLNDKGK